MKFTLDDVSALLQEKLNSLPGKSLTPAEFLKQLRDVDALIAKEQEDLYEFAHRSFQEYLAAVEIKATRQEELLLNALQPDKLEWWKETILLYAAQSDTSSLIKAILNQPSFETLQLGCNLLQEGLTIEPLVQEALRKKLSEVLQLLDPETIQLAEQKQLQTRYYKLGYYLQQQQWSEADNETYRVMVEVGDRNQKGYLDRGDIEQFPCVDLRIIDRLWVAYSNGLFGFSVQKKIYADCGATLDGKYPGDEIWEQFSERVGWRKDGKWQLGRFQNQTSSLSSRQQGNLPLRIHVVTLIPFYYYRPFRPFVRFCGWSLLSRTDL